jgi:phage N-6-adenine-methyltransferase
MKSADASLKDGASTPQWLFDRLNEEARVLTGQGFRLDAAACEWNAKCNSYIDERTDTLRQDWSKWPTIFCNPPYNAALISQFATKAVEAAEKGSTIVLLIPAWPGYPWFQDLKRRGRVQDILGPVAFERPDGSRFVLNNGRGFSLVAVTLGPKVTPGSNGEPITRAQASGWGSSVRDARQADNAAGLDQAILGPPIVTSYQCNNDGLMAQVARLYFRTGDRIADVTYGRGRFWRLTNMTQYDFHPSDLLTVPERPYDFRNLPYRSHEFDAHVFDPPYMHNPPARRYLNADYKNFDTTKGISHDDIIRLYRDGMSEGWRILKPGGLMLVKCKDEIESGRQRMSHVEVHDIAVKELGMEVRDLFVLTQKALLVRFRNNNHARKNHSYLWVFEK